MTPDQTLMVFVIIIGLMLLVGFILSLIVFFYIFKSAIQNTDFHLPKWMDKIADYLIDKS
jgi:hypothetical protein